MAILLYDLVGRDEARPFSPHCWKAAFALAHKGLEFSSVPTRFTEVRHVENGASKIVPVIRDGETVVADSFAIAEYLEETYPDRPSLFSGEGGRAAARFVESWVRTALSPHLLSCLLVDIHDSLDLKDRAYFRESREARFGKTLEEFTAGREDRRSVLHVALEPLRDMTKVQPFIGGRSPLFADYIVAGMFQWARVISPFRLMDPGDPATEWFERCLDLHGGLGRKVPAAA